ncbi:MAG: hypothetical protein A3K19_31120 [Lentisphaerae bacterium RIFOXYB12_FULL_65_16]|nr:MAG: hypothetical protein A3K18_26885 [Lentisphaerae bacterium RIFOXYA12_64_32]OGV88891.1 MAG: hypothetical protein A3K19_31120 [Lentisphaerae bacterium RIFOXYB12_FULL_65_16]
MASPVCKPNDTDQAAGLRLAARRATGHDGKTVVCLAVASGKGGVGKTFLSVNLALAFRQFNRRVLLVDADLGLANTDIVLGVNPKYTLQDALFQGYELADVVVHTPYGIDLLAASSGGREMVALGETRMGLFIDELLRFATQYDVLILDCAAGIGNSVTAFLAAAPLSLIVTTTQPTSIMDVYALIKVIRQENLGVDIALVPNMVADHAQAQRVLQRLTAAAETYLSTQLEVLPPIPFSDAVSRALYARRPLLAYEPDDAAARQVVLLARSILQKQKAATTLANLDIKGLIDGVLKG